MGVKRYRLRLTSPRTDDARVGNRKVALVAVMRKLQL